MNQIFNVKQDVRKKGLTIRVQETTVTEHAKLRKRIRQLSGIEHTLDDQFDKAFIKIISKANQELDQLDEKI